MRLFKGSKKGRPKKVFLVAWLRGRGGLGVVNMEGRGVLGAVTNKNCVVRDGRRLGWIVGCEHGGEGSFPRKGNESL